MKVLYAAALIALFASAAYGQGKQMPRYGETDDVRTPSEIENQRKADADYKRSLGNVPNAGPSDPWGDMRGAGGKIEPRSAPVKRSKAAPGN